MAKRRRARGSSPPATARPQELEEGYDGLDSDTGVGAESLSEFTGRKIVTILSDDPADKKKVCEYFSARDVKDMLQTADYVESVFDMADVSSSDTMVFDHLPILVLNDKPNVQAALAAQPASVQDEEVRRLFVVEDEKRHFMSCLDEGCGQQTAMGFSSASRGAGGQRGAEPPALSPYHQGYLRGIQSLASQMLGGLPDEPAPNDGAAISPTSFGGCFSDTASFTWGLQATGVAASSLTGNGIRVAILDTGFEFGHPDANFASRVVGNATFVGGTAQDHHGHGTHVAGTACGPRDPGLSTRRYGIASEAEILVARVLGPTGGNDTTILGGINWAIGQGCDLINMSLGPRVCVASPAFSASHERAARIALGNGILMIAAAGNNSSRPGRVCPVVGPAAAPSIVAVAAVDNCGRIASFSNQGQNSSGGEINFAAPGVDVFSAWTNPTRHRSIPGTSMASPHVAGIAALIAQQTGLRGLPLYRELRSRARDIGHSRADMGNGFVSL
ncbi:S8 family serine peptidase [Stieleria varia]|uniref:Subtilisin DY n=1 Tax=Stieleria varia TaxID=2528005 RepID=A0A5C6B7C0_9BACT|nr:S8 family serine peptidase [Stieleria varia]TWU07943.1 Subtilisin DY [Stieleria varia]